MKDEFLAKLAGRVPLEEPSADFTVHVMKSITVQPETVKGKRPFFLIAKSVYPWVLLGVFIIIFLFSSDIPYLSFIPTREFFHDHITPYFSSLFAGLSGLFTGNKTVSIILAILVSGGLLAAVDWLLRRKTETHHHAA